MAKKENKPVHGCPLRQLAQQYGLRPSFLGNDGLCWGLDAQNIRSCCRVSTRALMNNKVPDGQIVEAVQLSVESDKELDPDKRGYNSVRQTAILERLQRKI